MSEMENEELEKEAERVKEQTRQGCFIFLAILMMGIASFVYTIMKESYAFEIIFFFTFITVIITIKYLPIITLPARVSKIINSILLVLGFIIMILVFFTIWTEPFLPPPEPEPAPNGSLHRYGIQIKYAVLTSTLLFVIVILLNRKETLVPSMIIARLGLLVLLTPFVLLYLLLFYNELKNLLGLN